MDTYHIVDTSLTRVKVFLIMFVKSFVYLLPRFMSESYQSWHLSEAEISPILKECNIIAPSESSIMPIT